ncbi:MAG TPA: chromate transporter [Isosphaeraceae bacterium]|nr:chromate transporter [Isosphaeraceae bacterium]
MTTWTIFWRFGLISLLAFGGGAGTPLIERIAVRETGWITEREFGVALAFAQVLPGPVMSVATFIGYRAAGLTGALAATLGVFFVPWVLAAVTARHLGRLARHRWLSGFRRGAAAAAVGLLGVTALSLARHSLEGWAHLAIAAAAFLLALGTRLHPAWILLGGAFFGMLAGSPRMLAPLG